MKTILLVMDSLNRHYLSAYGDFRVKTPNIDRIAKRGVIFDNHFAGSLPCMPARREFMTGRLNFLERPWGPIEPWDRCLPTELRTQNKTYSHMITDHYHYFHSGGEAYHTLFDSWELERGQEGDVWHPLVKEPKTPEFKGKNRRAYWVNREFTDTENEEDYPTPRCFKRAIEFLDNNGKQDNWHLHLEVFDPHEPFVCPKKYTDMYNDSWDGLYHFDWPNYAPVSESDEAVEHIKKSYYGVLTMADAWLGKLLDKMDELDMWKDTTLILTTDHGHLLAEHGYWAKNYMFDYHELAHIPLIVCSPDTAFSGKRVSQLTATIDIMPTIMELHNAKIPAEAQGKSLVEMQYKDVPIREAVLYGYFGKDVNMYDGRYSYCRQPIENSTLYAHTLMPRMFDDFITREELSRAEFGCYLKHAGSIPQLRFPFKSHRHHNAPDYNIIHDIVNDPNQQTPISDEQLENKLVYKLKNLLHQYEAPQCQYERLGLQPNSDN